MLALSPLFVRPFSQQPSENPPSSQPFVFFLLPETQKINTPYLPVLIAVILPSELSSLYYLSDLFALSDNDFLPLYPLSEAPFFDEPSHSFLWLFFGSYEINPEQPTTSLHLSSYAFFDPFDPSLPPLAAFDELTLTVDLTSSEARKEKQESEETNQKGKASSEKEPPEKVQGQSERGQVSKVSEGSQASSKKSVAKEAAKRAIEKEPEAARKLFEQEIASKALSNARKNPKSTGKGNGLMITVGAYPEVLPADGKSTAFIVAKVTDETGKPLVGKEVLFWADGGQVLV